MTKKILLTLCLISVCFSAFAGIVDFTGGVSYGLGFDFNNQKVYAWKDPVGTSTRGAELKLTAKVTSTYSTITLNGNNLLSSDPDEREIAGYLSFKLAKALNNTYFPNLPSGLITLLCGNQGAMTALRAYPDYFLNYNDRLRTSSDRANTFAVTVTSQPYQGRLYMSPITGGFDVMGSFVWTPSTDFKGSVTAVQKGIMSQKGESNVTHNVYLDNGAIDVAGRWDLAEMFWLDNPLEISFSELYAFGKQESGSIYNQAALTLFTGYDEFLRFYTECSWLGDFGLKKHYFDLNTKCEYDLGEYLTFTLGAKWNFDKLWSSWTSVAYTLDVLTTTFLVDVNQDNQWSGSLVFSAELEGV